MKTYTYKKIDAFTSGPSLGNPAACLYLDQGDTLSDEEMLTIAKRHKGFVSEVVYCTQSDVADCKLTYYSSECEVDFCGHGTIACIYEYIKSTDRLRSKKEITIETNKKGLLTVYNELQTQDAVYIKAPIPIYLGSNLNREDISIALETSIHNLSEELPIDCINAGLRTLIIPMANLSQEVNLFPNESKLKLFCEYQDIDIILIYSLETSVKETFMHTRVFAPRFGYLEDPATGSGNSAFGYYLLKNTMWNGDSILIEQGGVDREYNMIRLAAKDNEVLFGGSATTCISGKYFVY